MATKKKPSEPEGLTRQLGIRVTEADNERLDAFAERFTSLTKNAIARTALLVGLDAIEKDPLLLLGDIKAKKGR